MNSNLGSITSAASGMTGSGRRWRRALSPTASLSDAPLTHLPRTVLFVILCARTWPSDARCFVRLIGG